MTLREFHNALRILMNIDRDDLERAGIIGRADHNAWGTFTRDPFRWFIRADDVTAEKLWRLIERRQFAVPPVKELAGTKPLILYFANEQNRAEFVALVHEAKPGMAQMVVP